MDVLSLHWTGLMMFLSGPLFLSIFHWWRGDRRGERRFRLRCTIWMIVFTVVGAIIYLVTLFPVLYA